MLFIAIDWHDTKEDDWFHLKQQIVINIKNWKLTESFLLDTYSCIQYIYIIVVCNTG